MMKRSTKLAMAATLLAMSVGASAATLPTTGNGSATVTVFSTNDATPFSYSFDLGITFNDILAAGFDTGAPKTFTLTGLVSDLAANPGAAANLVFDVSAASTTGSIATAGAFKLITTVDPTTTLAALQATTSGALSGANSTNNTWLTNTTLAGNPAFTTNPSDSTYANANYNIVYNSLLVNAGAATNQALPMYELVSARGSTAVVQSVTAFTGTWTIDLAAGTLTYTPAGTAVPLPPSAWLLISGIGGAVLLSRRRRRDGVESIGGAMAA
jgi:hypothetical protein